MNIFHCFLKNLPLAQCRYMHTHVYVCKRMHAFRGKKTERPFVFTRGHKSMSFFPATHKNKHKLKFNWSFNWTFVAKIFPCAWVMVTAKTRRKGLTTTTKDIVIIVAKKLFYSTTWKKRKFNHLKTLAGVNLPENVCAYVNVCAHTYTYTHAARHC